MNNENNQTGANIQFCSKTYDVDGQLVVNCYKCDSKISLPGVWSIQKTKKPIVIRGIDTIL
jgi:hypothetical protein